MSGRGAAYARSWLFVPATRPDRFPKALGSGADVVVVDLEDAVPDDRKAEAREAAAGWLAEGGRAAVRVNPAGTEHHDADVASLTGLPGLTAVLLPMAETVASLEDLRARLGPVALVPQVETAVGVHRSTELASAAGVARLAFGHLDLAVDIDAAPGPGPMQHARSTLVIACRVAGVAGPVDSVTTDLDDEAATRSDAALARSLGFTGKLCIHPQQVAAVNAAMSPGEEEVAWARSVLAADTSGAARVGGQMVDAPVLTRARRIMSRTDGGL